MQAIALTVAIFIYLFIVGGAIYFLAGNQEKIERFIYIFPALGLAASVLTVFTLSRVGIPVFDFANFLSLATLTAAILIWFKNLSSFKLPNSLALIFILGFALCLTAYPMVVYGFNWISYGNDDMANYSLSAQRFLQHGFYYYFDPEKFKLGLYYPSIFKFMHVDRHQRAGSELTLAYVSGVSGLNVHQVYMPLMIALYLVLVSAAGSLIEVKGKSIGSRNVVCFLTCISPLTILGAMYQLIGQLGGLAMMTACVALLAELRPSVTARETITKTFNFLLMFVGLLIWYPEVLPFLGLGYLIYFILQSRHEIKNGERFKKFIKMIIIISFGAILLLNVYIFEVIQFTISQLGTANGNAKVDIFIFPWYLKPIGLPYLLGILYINQPIPHIISDIAILCSVAVILWIIVCLLRKMASRADLVDCTLFGFFIVFGFFFIKERDFPLYKTAMYLQPFLLAFLVSLMSRNVSVLPVRVPVLLICSLAAFQIPAAIYYVRVSMSGNYGSMNELPNGSLERINEKFEKLVDSKLMRYDKNTVFIFNVSNVVEAKLQMLYLQGLRSVFPSREFIAGIMGSVTEGEISADVAARATQNYDQDLDGNSFRAIYPEVSAGKNVVYVTPKVEKSLFNKYGSNLDSSRAEYEVTDSPKNLLIFLHSELGAHYYSGARKKVAFTQLENDIQIPGEVFSALGKHLLFQVAGFEDGSRVVMDLTSTLVKVDGSQLPGISIQNTTLGVVGAGSARVFSGPIEPTRVNGIDVISIKFDRDGVLFPSRESTIMGLYGSKVPLDGRYVTAHGRDISIISDKQYRAIIPPSAVSHFPDDLKNPSLEYSGVYEDGWISPSSFFVLSSKPKNKMIRIIGFVPNIDGVPYNGSLSISVDDQIVSTLPLNVGKFDFTVSHTVDGPKVKIGLNFSSALFLPGDDGRVIGGKIQRVEIE